MFLLAVAVTEVIFGPNLSHIYNTEMRNLPDQTQPVIAKWGVPQAERDAINVPENPEEAIACMKQKKMVIFSEGNFFWGIRTGFNRNRIMASKMLNYTMNWTGNDPKFDYCIIAPDMAKDLAEFSAQKRSELFTDETIKDLLAIVDESDYSPKKAENFFDTIKKQYQGYDKYSDRAKDKLLAVLDAHKKESAPDIQTKIRDALTSDWGIDVIILQMFYNQHKDEILRM